MRDTIFLCGIDDSQQFDIKEKGNGEYQLNINNGITPISLLINNVEPIKSKKLLHIVGLHKTIKLTKNIKHYNVFNLVGDSESSSTSLNLIKSFVNKHPINRVINHPKLIEQTSRVNLPNTLSGIDGVKLAKVTSCNVRNIQEVKKAIEAHKFKYPLIIRKKGYHNGQFAELIHNESELYIIENWLIEPSELNLIEFLNVKDKKSKFYHKYRISVVDGKFYPQHLLSCNTWKVMARQQCMLENSELRVLEQNFMDNFESDFLKTHKQKLQEIHSRIKLDYYGIDCAVNDNGELIVFEANSCMSLLDYWRGNDSEFDYKIPSRIAVRTALFNLIAK